MIQIRFGDLAALAERVGEEFSPYRDQVLIIQEMIDHFADLTGDRQRIHVDVERARRDSPFKTTIAHGFFILSLVPRLRVRPDLQLVGYGNVTNHGLWTHIDCDGALIHGRWFVDLDVFHNGFARARDESGWMHVDRAG